MWLLDVYTFELKDFSSKRVPQYAILSHTWSADEIGFSEIQDLTTAKRRPAFAKIQQACLETRRVSLGYLWVDTCCIDKSSSAELQEAINSMFEWYRCAEVCLAHLSDVQHDRSFSRLSDTTTKQLVESRWFKRGWTLQELIAPCSILFFDRNWNKVGSRESLQSHITEATAIPRSFFTELHRNGPREALRHCSIAQRMSWASRRETSRVEDNAYCLLGIFGINMPLLYGEKERAFQRLQEEILRTTFDLTILCWLGLFSTDLLAEEPSLFTDCQTFISERVVYDDNSGDLEMNMTNAGLRMRLPLLKVSRPNGKSGLAAILHCHDTNDVTSTLALKLSPSASSAFQDVDELLARDDLALYIGWTAFDGYWEEERLTYVDLLDVEQKAVSRNVIIGRSRRNHRAHHSIPWTVLSGAVWIRVRSVVPGAARVSDSVYPACQWDQEKLVYSIPNQVQGHDNVNAATTNEHGEVHCAAIVLPIYHGRQQLLLSFATCASRRDDHLSKSDQSLDYGLIAHVSLVDIDCEHREQLCQVACGKLNYDPAKSKSKQVIALELYAVIITVSQRIRHGRCVIIVDISTSANEKVESEPC